MKLRWDRLAACVAASAMAVALSTGAAMAGDGYTPAPHWVATAEGGLACMSGDKLIFGSGEKHADRGCGATAALSIGQVHAPLIWGFDAWNFGVRVMGAKDKSTAFPTDFYKDRRTTVDLDVSRPLGNFGFLLGDLRALAGVRYANWRGDTSDGSAVGRFGFSGAGPRLGVTSTSKLWDGWRLESLYGASALFGSHDVKVAAPGIQVGQSHSGTVFALESSTSLVYAFARHGPELALGLRSEYWLKQISLKEDATFTSFEKNRNFMSPFLRLNVPLR